MCSQKGACLFPEVISLMIFVSCFIIRHATSRTCRRAHLEHNSEEIPLATICDGSSRLVAMKNFTFFKKMPVVAIVCVLVGPLLPPSNMATGH